MKIHFVGASDNHVTGSCTHFVYSRKRVQFLVDCGLNQGDAHADLRNEQPFPFKASDIKFVILTHAHIDHCGLLPKLYREGFRGAVFCTTATAEFARLALSDSVQFMRGLYTEEDVRRIRFNCVDQRQDFGLSKFIPIDDDLFASFTRSAHVLGAVSVTISWILDDNSSRCIVMSGDLGNNTKGNPYQPLLAARQETVGVPDYMVVESTYGSRTRDSKFADYDGRLHFLNALVYEAALNRKKLVIPSFSLHRTQEIVFDLACILSEGLKHSLPTDIPILPAFVMDFCESEGAWDATTQGRLERAIATLPEDEQHVWKESVIVLETEDEAPTKFSFSKQAKRSFDDFRKLMNQYTKPLKLHVNVDSPLALKMTSVFATELSRRKRKNPEETLYRNPKIAERLGLESEAAVDNFLLKIFPKNQNPESLVISLGNHRLLFHNRQEVNEKTKWKMKQKQSADDKTSPPITLGSITISGGGMCEGGRILDYLQKALPDDKAIIVISGFMAPNTLGGKLCELWQCRQDDTPPTFTHLDINGVTISVEEIRAEIINIGSYYSGHADQAGLLQYVFRSRIPLATDDAGKSTTVFINHGSREARLGLLQAIEAHTRQDDERQINGVELACSERWYDLDLHTWCEPERSEEVTLTTMIRTLVEEQRKTNQLLEKLIAQIARK